MRILSVNIGTKQEVLIKGRPTPTGFDKRPTLQRTRIGHFGLQGDVRVETRKMGLEHHAVYAYPHEHYAYWQAELARPAFPFGQFGENLTVTGLLEDEVRIGDIFRFGTAVLQVAQPRIPCAKLNERMGLRFSPTFMASRKVGYYLRVLEEGEVAPDDPIELLERDPSSPTMEEFVRVSQYEYWDARGLRQLLQARDLMPPWQEIIEAKLERTMAAAGGWHGLRDFFIVRRDEEGPHMVSLTLRCARGQKVPTFRGGQYLTVVLGAHTAHQQRRFYALTSRPDDSWAYRICVRLVPAQPDGQAPGVVSSHLLSLPVGARVTCSAPGGQMTLDDAATAPGRVPLLLSQGLGIAAMFGLLLELQARQAPQAYLFHQPSGPDPQLLMQEIEALVQRNPGFHLVRLASDGTHDARFIGSQLALTQADVFMSGTRDFIDKMSGRLQGAGVDAGAIKSQSFG